jgi:hypothetical protein
MSTNSTSELLGGGVAIGVGAGAVMAVEFKG